MKILKWLSHPLYLLLVIIAIAIFVNRDALFPEENGVHAQPVASQSTLHQGTSDQSKADAATQSDSERKMLASPTAESSAASVETGSASASVAGADDTNTPDAIVPPIVADTGSDADSVRSESEATETTTAASNPDSTKDTASGDIASTTQEAQSDTNSATTSNEVEQSVAHADTDGGLPTTVAEAASSIADKQNDASTKEAGNGGIQHVEAEQSLTAAAPQPGDPSEPPVEESSSSTPSEAAPQIADSDHADTATAAAAPTATAVTPRAESSSDEEVAAQPALGDAVESPSTAPSATANTAPSEGVNEPVLADNGSADPVSRSNDAPQPAPVASAQSAGANDTTTDNTESAALALAYQTWNDARIAAWAGRYLDAIALYNKLIDMQPKNFDAYGELGNVYLRMGNRSAAANAYSTAAVKLRDAGLFPLAWRVAVMIDAIDPAKAYKLRLALAAQ